MSLSNEKYPVVIDCRDVVKKYYYYSHRTSSLREWFVRTVKRQAITVRGPQYILSAFSLSVRKGETMALIGPNGSGKSTILRLIAGIYQPTEGQIEVDGQVSAIMELGVGFHPELTGAENVTLCASFMGLHPEQVDERYPDIVEFADIGDFIETPVKYYSTGMQARLAFAVSLNLHLDIVLIDEVLAVGDSAFQTRCIDKLTEFQKNGGTILMASHDMTLVQRLCQHAVWIEYGTVKMIGDAEEVVKAYQQSIMASSQPAQPDG